MSVDRSALLSGGLHLDTLLASLHRVARVHATYDEIRVPIVVAVRNEDSRVLPEAGSQHVSDDS